MMKINGARRFKGNDRKSYFVQEAYKQDRDKGKYVLTVIEDGYYKLCYDIFYNSLFFNTIKDAQRKVLYDSDFITTM